NGLPLLRDLWQPNEQGICEFVAGFVAVNVRHDDLGCARAINVFDEPSGLRVCSIAYVPEMSQRAVRFSANLLPQPGERLEAIGFSQQPGHRNAMNAPLRKPNRFEALAWLDRKSTRLNSSHRTISYAVFCLKKKNKQKRYLFFQRFKHSFWTCFSQVAL